MGVGKKIGSRKDYRPVHLLSKQGSNGTLVFFCLPNPQIYRHWLVAGFHFEPQFREHQKENVQNLENIKKKMLKCVQNFLKISKYS